MGFAGSQTQDVNCFSGKAEAFAHPFLSVYCPIHTTSLAGGLLFLQAVHVFFLLSPTFLGRNLKYKGRRKDYVPVHISKPVRYKWKSAGHHHRESPAHFWPLLMCNLLAHLLVTSLVSTGLCSHLLPIKLGPSGKDSGPGVRTEQVGHKPSVWS